MVLLDEVLSLCLDSFWLLPVTLMMEKGVALALVLPYSSLQVVIYDEPEVGVQPASVHFLLLVELLLLLVHLSQGVGIQPWSTFCGARCMVASLGLVAVVIDPLVDASPSSPESNQR